ncbi:MAG: hypothetical protein DMF61_14785 [Blastocatellia bacterium AA13]|nr:MAG: hypothetical protein DMF61_14785 [Blastocatellia bacterium AA13]
MSSEDNKGQQQGSKEKAKDEPLLLQYYKPSVSLAKALVWPLIILFIFFQARESILEAISLFPYLLSRASVITIAGVTIEVD